jgi:GAF domain-containing protein
MVDHERLSMALIEFSHRLVGDYEAVDILHLLCDRAAEILPVDGAGVMLLGDDDHLHFVAASDETVREIESLQIELGEGPCLQAFETGEQVVVTGLSAASLFPRFAPGALARGLRAVYSFPMRFGEQRIGALNLYRGRPGPFLKEDALAGQVLADVATTSILNARAAKEANLLVRQLQHALDTRVVIEQAKGKLSEQWGVDVGAAFTRLRTYARRNGMKLHTVAEQVVSGELRIDT